MHSDDDDFGFFGSWSRSADTETVAQVLPERLAIQIPELRRKLQCSLRRPALRGEEYGRKEVERLLAARLAHDLQEVADLVDDLPDRELLQPDIHPNRGDTYERSLAVLDVELGGGQHAERRGHESLVDEAFEAGQALRRRVAVRDDWHRGLRPHRHAAAEELERGLL